MATKCKSREHAESIARQMRSDGASAPAVVNTRLIDLVSNDYEGRREWWAARDSDDLDTVPGLIEEMMVIR